MALKTKPAARSGRRVPLSRGKAGPAKNSRRELRQAKQGTFPWQSLLGACSTVFFIMLILLVVGAVGLGLLYTYRGLTAGEYFALKTLEIQGNSRLSSREILEIADLIDGGNTLALSISTVEGALASNPWVERVSVKRILPDTLIIGIKEKEPAFWRLEHGELHYADAHGTLIAPVNAGKFASLPTLEVEPGAEDALAALPDLVRSLDDSELPLNMAAVSLVRLSSARGVEVYVDETRLKISIGLEEWLPNLRRLGLTLGDLARRGELRDVHEIRAQGSNVWVERHSGTKNS